MSKRGRKPKMVSERLRKNVHKRPEFLDNMPTRGDKARAISIIAEQIRSMGTDEVLKYENNEFMEKFRVKTNVKAALAYIKNQLVTIYKIKNIRTYKDPEDGRIYIWKGFSSK